MRARVRVRGWAGGSVGVRVHARVYESMRALVGACRLVLVGARQLSCTGVRVSRPPAVPNVFMDVSIPGERVEDGVQVTIMDSSGHHNNRRVHEQVLLCYANRMHDA